MGITHLCVPNSVEAEGKEGGKEEEESYGRSMAKVLTSSREDPLAWVTPFSGKPTSSQQCSLG